MQHIRDKEFDQLFRDKFEAAEMQPSADLWGNIAGRLKPGRRRKLPVYWLAAAVILVVIGIGLIMPETEKIRLHGRTDLTAVTVPAVVPRPLEITTPESQASASDYQSTPLIIAPRLKPEVESTIALRAVQPERVKDRLKNVVPAEIVKEVVPPLKEPVPVVISDPVLASANEEEIKDDVAPGEKTTYNKGIRNVGDVINFVVNKIDRREKKIIQFDTDDDNSSVIALNIGFIKFNRRSGK